MEPFTIGISCQKGDACAQYRPIHVPPRQATVEIKSLACEKQSESNLGAGVERLSDLTKRVTPPA
jgi:hypothetical protein